MKKLILILCLIFISYRAEAAPTTINTTSYDAFSTSLRLNNDTVMHVFREGTSHASDFGKLVREDYTISTSSWGTRSDVFDAVTIDVRDPVLGRIGTKIFCFFSKYDFSKQTSSGYITSTDEGVTWSSYTEIYAATANDDGMNFHNGFIKNKTASKYMVPWARHEDSPVEWKLEMFFTLDDGDSWDTVLVVDSSTKWVEPSLAHIGAGRIVGVARDNAGAGLGYYTSSDDGLTWTTPAASTVLGDSSSIKPSAIYYDSVYDNLLVSYLDRVGGGKFKYSYSEDPLFTTGGEDNWPATVTLDSTGYDNFGNGYSAMERISSTEILIIWSKQSSSSDSDILYELVTLGDGDS